MVGRTAKITKADRERFEKIVEVGCMACRERQMHPQCGATEANHLLSGGKRRGHECSVPLGSWHHRGIPLAGWTSKEMAEWFGPSLRLQSKLFRETFGDDDTLLARVNELIRDHKEEAA